MQEMEVTPILSDSMGAKSMCVRIDTPDTSVIIDPAAAVMQKSYPMDGDRKYSLLSEARERIEEAARDAEHAVVTHYHYDHHFLPDTGGMDFSKVFTQKDIWIKDPNRWINPSQWERSREFLKALITYSGKGKEVTSLDEHEFEPEQVEYDDPMDDLPLARDLDAGDYEERREELHEKWRDKFYRRVDMWNTEEHVEEPLDKVHYADGKSFEEGETTVRFTEPLFHGIEYSKTGWVIAVVVERKDEKFIYTSDLQGPTVEDYAQWIIEEDPDFLVLDGPATYLLGFMLNNFNLHRSIDNAARIVEKADFETMLYDHHIMREKGYKEKTEKIWDTVEQTGKEVLSYREYVEQKPPLVEEL